MNEYGRWLAVAVDRWWVRVVAWLLVAAVMGGQWYHARYRGFADRRSVEDPNRRPDGHSGHAQIDFGGQWLFGRMLVTGHGTELYHRSAYWDRAWKAFPRDRQDPSTTEHDAEGLVGCFVGFDPPERRGSLAIAVAPFANDPIIASASLAASLDALTPTLLESAAHPERPADIGGPLYPPIHAFLMAPLALDDDAQGAYFAWQWVLMGVALLAGYGVSYLTNGRIWWSAAVLLIVGFPGYRPALALGQNSVLTLALVIWGWALNVRGRPIAGGAVWGMLAYKPVWGLTFFVAALAMRQWRLCVAMCVVGLSLVAATVPFVGVQCWKDWLHVGGEAAALYDVDHNWVFLSRDLFGIPRRMMLDYELPRDGRETLAAKVAAWALWLCVFEATVRIWTLRRRGRPIPLTGPMPAFLFLAAWACCYHFMYYDALMASVGVFVLLAARPKRFFDPPTASLEPGGGVLLLNSFVLTVLAILIVHEGVISGLDIQVTASVGYVALESGSPTAYLASGVRYPWDTLIILVLWFWCAILAYRDDETQSK